MPVPARAAPGATVMVDGRPAIVLFILPRLAGRPPAARVTHEPPCRLCEAQLTWRHAHRRWECPQCHDHPAAEQLADWAREHRQDAIRAGTARREWKRRGRQVARGAPSAAAILRRAAAAGGALSRVALLDGVTGGAARRALRWGAMCYATAPPSECPMTASSPLLPAPRATDPSQNFLGTA